jgi:hypothetical protein
LPATSKTPPEVVDALTDRRQLGFEVFGAYGHRRSFVSAALVRV